MTPTRLPYLHKNARSRLPQTGELIDLGPISRYEYDQGQGGAAWHAVAMSRADKEAAA
ncbi:hypothetical protein SEA_GAUGELDP_53 [Mycobacterium phage GaugeLDP]|uniref:Uncharacterized protein n=1 Tax=Mycobacterium phage BabyBack TaxID=3158877 RepID=A0AAU8GUF0_9CAUD|nr:hypothetical protein SEA_GAUGELDP_53 [Mycobacterium phage GaugeLDP]